VGGTPVSGTPQQYDVAPDGRFLINVSMDETAAAPITVITNWDPEAKKQRVGARCRRPCPSVSPVIR
jgi:hypothetical protein